MLYKIIMIIVGFEIIDFIIRAILPDNKLDSSINNAVNMIIFASIVILCTNIIMNNSFNLFSPDSISWSDDIHLADFQDYINTYKKIISNALE